MKTHILLQRVPRRNRKFVDCYKIGPNENGSIRTLRVGELKLMFVRYKENKDEGA